MDSIINNFNLTVSTVNGSGSATANNTLLRALFRMGIPVSGKNIFPSNIQGQPTWFTIRINQEGYLARQEKDDIVIAMNPMTIRKEIECVCKGGVLFYADYIHLPIERSDIHVYPMAIKEIVNQVNLNPSVRDYVANMVYVGVTGQMLGLDLEKVYEAIDYHFKGKEKAVQVNWQVVEAAAKWADQNLTKSDNYFLKSLPPLNGYIMVDGNTAAALGAIYGGVQFNAWYPITPATSISESLNEYLPQLRRDPATGKDTFVVVQAEDELSAIGMAIGAGYAGLRSMTSTSGPGLSLMSEYLGLAYYTEVPVVIWDVQRVGPSTGLPTRTAQGDLTQSYFISHGDKNMIILIPGTVTECFEFGWKAFDIAERIQTPVIVLSDLDLGMNEWLTKEFVYPEKPMDRGKILWEDDLEKILKENNNMWGRYLDVDGDGIAYRTVPGNTHPLGAYFARGTGHDEFAKYSEDSENWEKNLNRLAKKFETAKTILPLPEIMQSVDACLGIVGYGSTDQAILEARDLLSKDGLKSDYCRIRAIPFTDEIKKFIEDHEIVYVIEINRDGQMCQLLQITYPEFADRFVKICHSDGLPLTARWINESIRSIMEKKS
ncbi:pyruvate ferredoxin oxidoreductase [Leptolinea sp. HRD-7]|nr:pyruvate ferredoxin oxidoreductase [Leptolinea sp. HRD-7]